MRLYTADAIRALERKAESLAGFSAAQLMRVAGRAVWRTASENWPDAQRIGIICGHGNNAGDGYVCAELAHAAGRQVRLVSVGDPAKLSTHARACFDACIAAGLTNECSIDAIDDCDLLIDALIGIGISRRVSGFYAAAIERINAVNCPILSIDLPSGIDPDTGRRWGTAVRATVTLSLLGAKQGLFTGEACDYRGRLIVDDLGLPSQVFSAVPPGAIRVAEARLANAFAPRARNSHKGHNGHVLVVGGGPGFAGAARLAGTAAARCGAGLVSLATHSDSVAAASAARPELMVHRVSEPGDLEQLLASASVIAVGPGLGQSNWAVALFARILQTRLPLVVDADALNLLARDPIESNRWVLTPHPGEAGRLLKCSSDEINQDRFKAARHLHSRFGGVVVLKGAGTIIDDGRAVSVISAGNPGMASGGMGDVLTGVIAALIAQGFAPAKAATIGACLHSTAADRAARDGERGLLASDLMPHIRSLVNP